MSFAKSHASEKHFREYRSVNILKDLAANPYDLTLPQALSEDRFDRFSAKAGEFNLIYATERVTQDVMAALQELAAESHAIEKMADMQSGKVINKIEGMPSENRAVLHTAMRDFFHRPNTSSSAKEAANLAKAEVDKLQKFINTIDHSGKFTDLIQIGIGGSELGPKALYIALKAYSKPGKRVHFISNIDPDEASLVLNEIDPKKTLVVVVSKSGTTLETLTNEEILRDFFKEKGCDPKDHFIAVTGQGSPMDDPKRYVASFYIWDYVGGRYSATSMVGGVMLAFAIGLDGFLNVLKGAHEMDLLALNRDFSHNLPLIAATIGIWNRNFLHHPMVAILPYSSALSRFAAHLQQCDMESNGKHIDKTGMPVDFNTGPIIWGEPGTNGQHSFYQLLHQGTTVVPIEFIGFRESQYGRDRLVHHTTSQEKLNANLFAQAIAFARGEKSENPNKVCQGNRPSSLLLGKRLDPFTMGELLAYYEHKIAFQGFIWNINSFDQEGVQLGKRLANQILDIMGSKRTHTPAKDFKEAKAFLRHLDTL